MAGPAWGAHSVTTANPAARRGSAQSRWLLFPTEAKGDGLRDDMFCIHSNQILQLSAFELEKSN